MQNDSDVETFPTRQSAGAHRVKKLFLVLAEYSAILLTIRS